MLPDITPPAAGANERSGVMLDAIHSLLVTLAPYGQEGIALDTLLSEGIWPVADAAGIDRLCVFRVAGEGEPVPRMRQIYRWMRAQGGTTPLVQALAEAVPNLHAMRQWLVTLIQDKCVFFAREELGGAETDFAKKHLLETVLLVPVFYGGSLWGVVSFEADEPAWRAGDETLKFLRSAARICTNFIIRAEITRMADEAFEAYKRETETSLATLKAVLGGLDAMILVTVPATGEILFVNDNIKEFFGAEGDGSGKICYEFLNGTDHRCEHCPYEQLQAEPDKVLSWEAYYPPKDCTHRLTSMLVDWPGGVKAQLDFAIEITDIRRGQAVLEQREQMMGALNGAALALLAKKEEAFEEAMNEGITNIALTQRGHPDGTEFLLAALGKYVSGFIYGDQNIRDYL